MLPDCTAHLICHNCKDKESTAIENMKSLASHHEISKTLKKNLRTSQSSMHPLGTETSWSKKPKKFPTPKPYPNPLPPNSFHTTSTSFPAKPTQKTHPNFHPKKTSPQAYWPTPKPSDHHLGHQIDVDLQVNPEILKSKNSRLTKLKYIHTRTTSQAPPQEPESIGFTKTNGIPED